MYKLIHIELATNDIYTLTTTNLNWILKNITIARFPGFRYYQLFVICHFFETVVLKLTPMRGTQFLYSVFYLGAQLL